jgi:hypothetical protein
VYCMLNTLLKRLCKLTTQELFSLCEAIDIELQRRDELVDDTPDSARRRALQREQGYRRRIGATAPPIRAVGLGKVEVPRRAA